jgi:hypothetical protein
MESPNEGHMQVMTLRHNPPAHEQLNDGLRALEQQGRRTNADGKHS